MARRYIVLERERAAYRLPPSYPHNPPRTPACRVGVEQQRRRPVCCLLTPTVSDVCSRCWCGGARARCEVSLLIAPFTIHNTSVQAKPLQALHAEVEGLELILAGQLLWLELSTFHGVACAANSAQQVTGCCEIPVGVAKCVDPPCGVPQDRAIRRIPEVVDGNAPERSLVYLRRAVHQCKLRLAWRGGKGGADAPFPRRMLFYSICGPLRRRD